MCEQACRQQASADAEPRTNEQQKSTDSKTNKKGYLCFDPRPPGGLRIQQGGQYVPRFNGARLLQKGGRITDKKNKGPAPLYIFG